MFSRDLESATNCHQVICHGARVELQPNPDGRLTVIHGPRKLADYTLDGALAAETIDADPGRRTAEAG